MKRAFLAAALACAALPASAGPIDNGLKLNGLELNGLSYNGRDENGLRAPAPETRGAARGAADFAFRGVTLPGGEAVALD